MIFESLTMLLVFAMGFGLGYLHRITTELRRKR